MNEHFVLMAIIGIAAIGFIAFILHNEMKRLKRCPNCKAQSCTPLDPEPAHTFRIWECSLCGYSRREHWNIDGYYPPHF